MNHSSSIISDLFTSHFATEFSSKSIYLQYLHTKEVFIGFYEASCFKIKGSYESFIHTHTDFE